VDARGRISNFSPQPLEPPASQVPALAGGWVAEPVKFDAGGVTIYGTYTHPRAAAPGSLPGALLIVGAAHNGPGDPYDTLTAVATRLSADGIASLRYDKLSTGKPGWDGSAAVASDPARVGMQPFKHEASAALAFLARPRSIDRRRLAVFGHSEGGLYALLLATGGLGGNAPKVQALGLLEPVSIRVLDLVDEWVSAQVASARQAGHLGAAQASSIKKTLARAIASLRTTGTFPRDLPDWMASEFGFNAAGQLYLAQKDRYDPAAVAAKLTPQMPVLLTCSNADYQVSCGDVNHLAAGLVQARAKLDLVHLDGVDHFLREDPSRGSGPYTEPLAFSPQLQSALRAFTAATCDGEHAMPPAELVKRQRRPPAELRPTRVPRLRRFGRRIWHVSKPIDCLEQPATRDLDGISLPSARTGSIPRQSWVVTSARSHPGLCGRGPPARGTLGQRLACEGSLQRREDRHPRL
jgi:acetyl esterase/lipase